MDGPEVVNEVAYNSLHVEIPQIRPWVRFWAKALDFYLFSYFTQFIIGLGLQSIFLPREVIQLTYNFTYTWLISIVGLTLIEPIFISKWGTTPGKWLLGIHVYTTRHTGLNIKLAFNRTVLSFLHGWGFCLPVVSLFTSIYSYRYLEKNGIAKWDKDLGTMVQHDRFSPAKVVIAILLSIILLITLKSN